MAMEHNDTPAQLEVSYVACAAKKEYKAWIKFHSESHPHNFSILIWKLINQSVDMDSSPVTHILMLAVWKHKDSIRLADSDDRHLSLSGRYFKDAHTFCQYKLTPYCGCQQFWGIWFT